jgi:integrase
MGRKQVPGLIMRSGIWHIDKRIFGRRICQSTGTARLEEAERMLARVMEEFRQAYIYGARPLRTFEQAAAKFVLENQHKRSIADDVSRLKDMMPFIGTAPLDRVHLGTLQPWIDHKRRQGRKVGTINNGLQVVRRILNLAAGEWADDQGVTWLQSPSKIKLLRVPARRQPYPLSWKEQLALFRELPPHLAQMSLFTVNTGCRASEVCDLLWSWEVAVPEVGSSVFIVPGTDVKNGDDRLVVLNSVARSVIEARRGQHPTHVFTFDGKPVSSMLNTAWKKARARAGLPMVRVHDLKHTFGRRLRAAGVSFEDRQDLLGHRSGRITTHYSAAELSRLIEAAERVAEQNGSQPELVVLRGNLVTAPAKLPQEQSSAAASTMQVVQVAGAG